MTHLVVGAVGEARLQRALQRSRGAVGVGQHHALAVLEREVELLVRRLRLPEARVQSVRAWHVVVARDQGRDAERALAAEVELERAEHGAALDGGRRGESVGLASRASTLEAGLRSLDSVSCVEPRSRTSQARARPLR